MATIKRDRYGRGLPRQPDGMPQGRHLTGFKGSKVDAVCLCGKCNPAAREGVRKIIYA